MFFLFRKHDAVLSSDSDALQHPSHVTPLRRHVAIAAAGLPAKNSPLNSSMKIATPSDWKRGSLRQSLCSFYTIKVSGRVLRMIMRMLAS